MGYIRGVVHGAVLGTAVGLCLAPQEGAETRRRLRGVAQGARTGARQASGAIRQAAPAVQSAARSVVGGAISVRDQLARRRATEADALELETALSADGNR